MNDTIIKGTGNSRTLKTVPNALTLYPDHAAMIQAMIDGTFPIDLGGLNAAGIEQRGTDLNKANLLTDATENALWGNTGNRTIDQAVNQLRALITTAQNTANLANSQVVIGQYTGNDADTQFVSLGFTPRAVIVWNLNGRGYSGRSYPDWYYGMCLQNRPLTYTYTSYSSQITVTILDIAANGFNARKGSANEGNSHIALNTATYSYMYIAFR